MYDIRDFENYYKESDNSFFKQEDIDKMIISEDQIDRTKPIHAFPCLPSRWECLGLAAGPTIEYIIEDDGRIIIVGEKNV
jgi:hypothetical protein